MLDNEHDKLHRVTNYVMNIRQSSEGYRNNVIFILTNKGRETHTQLIGCVIDNVRFTSVESGALGQKMERRAWS